MRLLTTQRSPQSSRSTQPVGVRLIILEDGALGFEPPAPSSEGALEVAVLVQSAGESPGELVERTRRRLSQLERADRAVTEAVIAAGNLDAGAVLEARRAIAEAIVQHMAKRGTGEIALAAGSDARPELRHELLSLAEVLTTDPSSRHVSVRVLFSTPAVRSEHRSGVHAPVVGPRPEAFPALTG